MGLPQLPSCFELERALSEKGTLLVRDLRAGGRRVLKPRLGSKQTLQQRLEAARRQVGLPLVLETELIELEGRLYCVRPYLEGDSLSDRLRAARPPLSEGRTLFHRLCLAVDSLHAGGLVHGRIHPRNVIQDAAGGLWLIDFLDGASPRSPAEFAPPEGFEVSASPEQLRGSPPSFRSDLHGLGLIACELFAGEHPYRGGPWLDVLQRALFQDPRLTAAAWSHLPEQCLAILERALARHPRRRPSRATALAEAFAEPAAPSTATPTPPPSPLPTPAPIDPAKTRLTRRGSTTARLLWAARHTSSTPQIVRARGAMGRAAARVTSAVSLAAHRWWSVPVRLRLGAPLGAAVAVGSALFALGAFRQNELEAEVESALRARQLGRARAAVLRAGRERGTDDPTLRKLRGDIACAEGEHQLCLLEYDKTLSAEDDYASDDRLRQNVLAQMDRGDRRWLVARLAARIDGIEKELVERTADVHYWRRWNAVRALEARGESDRVRYSQVYALDVLHAGSCETRRAALRRLVELKDESVLPMLESARAKADQGLFGDLCLGDDLDRAIRRIESPSGS